MLADMLDRILDCCKSGAISERNCSPAAESTTLRVVRLKSLTAKRSSSATIAWLNADDDMPSWRAAARKPPCRATAATASNSLKLALIARCSSSACPILSD